MALDKAIKYGKEHRKEYIGCKAIDCSCRNHGGCEWCRDNRMYQRKRIDEASAMALLEYLMEENKEVLIRLKNI